MKKKLLDLLRDTFRSSMLLSSLVRMLQDEKIEKQDASQPLEP
ncbi:hypothetical protein [Pontibacter ummariensis]|nr:hypothetical protein [Pontibacter ummariensis]